MAEQNYEPDIYKHFFRTKTTGGFLSLRGWLNAGKLAIDIGELASEGGLKQNTLVWAPAVALATYLQAVALGTATSLYPRRKDTESAESYIYYGGGNTADGPVSRILRVQYWQGDPNSFEWKTGHFAATVSASGAFMPNMDTQLSSNRIKIGRVQMAEMSYLVNLAITAYTREEQWLTHLTGKDR